MRKSRTPAIRKRDQQRQVGFYALTSDPDGALAKLRSTESLLASPRIDWIDRGWRVPSSLEDFSKSPGSAIVVWLSASPVIPERVRSALEFELELLDKREPSRIFVYLDQVNVSSLHASDDPLLRRILAIVQIAQVSTLTELVREVQTYLLEVDQLDTRASLRRSRMQITGWFEEGIRNWQYFSALFLTVPYALAPYIGRDELFAWLRSLNVSAIAFTSGAVIFPSIAIIAYSLFGRRSSPGISFVMGLVATFVIADSFNLRRDVAGPVEWVWLGIIVGLVADVLRRSALRAAWRQQILKGQLPTLDTPRQADVDALLSRHWMTTPMGWPILRTSSPVVFISYASDSPMSDRAIEFHARATATGLTALLDRQFIRFGSSWREELHYAMAEATVFVAFVDSVSVRRKWPAFELYSALRQRHRTGVPEIRLVAEPDTLLEDESGWFPVFRSCLRSLPPSSGLIRIHKWHEGVSAELANELASAAFTPPGLLPPFFGRLASRASEALICLGYAAPVGGLILILGLAVTDRHIQVPGIGYVTLPLGAFWYGRLLRELAVSVIARHRATARLVVRWVAALSLSAFVLWLVAATPLPRGILGGWISLAGVLGIVFGNTRDEADISGPVASSRRAV